MKRRAHDSRRARHAGPLSVVLVACGALGLSCRYGAAPERLADPEKPRGGTVAASATVSPPSTSTVLLEPRTLGWERGKQYSYAVKLSTQVSFDGKSAGFDFDLAGNVDVDVASTDEQSALLYLSFSDAKVVNRVPGSRAELDRMTTELRRSGAFITLRGGLSTTLDVSPELSDMTMSTYRQLGAALQFAHARGDATKYSAEEYDATGKYLAEYQRSGGVWQKRKASYSSLLGLQALPGSDGLTITPHLFASSGEVRLSADGRPESVKVMDELGLKGATSPLRSKVSLELTTRGVTADPGHDFEALRAATQRIASSEPLRRLADSHSLDDARIGNLDFETILAELEHRHAVRKDRTTQADDTTIRTTGAIDESEVQADSRRFMALAAIFRKDPGAIKKAEAQIRRKSVAAGDLLDALSSASTPEAQRSLVGLLGTKGIDKESRARVVFSLARLPEPTSDATRALRVVAEDEPFNSNALYGLGTHARLYRDAGKRAQAKEIGEFLVGRLRLADDSSTRSLVLRAIANSGYDGALPEVLAKLSNRDEDVRVAALRAVQSMLDPRVDELLARFLRTDSSEKARLSAIESAALREPSKPLVTALELAATEDGDPHVRYSSVELLGRWLPQRPELRAALETVARNDDEPKVRERAKALL